MEDWKGDGIGRGSGSEGGEREGHQGLVGVLVLEGQKALDCCFIC